MNNETTSAPIHANSVCIIGCGNVGTVAAYSLIQSELVREIVLIDRDMEKAEGEAMDLQHAVAVPTLSPVNIRVGSYTDAAQCSIVVITAGVGSKPGESRLDLLDKNVEIIRDIVRQLMRENFDGILLMTTNPVDVLAQVAQEESGLPIERVISTGTVLDTARLRELLAGELGVEPRAVDAYIIGEHGDSEIAVFSQAKVAGVSLRRFTNTTDDAELPTYEKILESVREAAPEIVRRKGNTSFAIGSTITRICQAILRDEHMVLPVSTLLRGEYGIEGVYMGTPCIIGKRGVERVIELELNDKERKGLDASAKVLKGTLGDLRAKNPTLQHNLRQQSTQ